MMIVFLLSIKSMPGSRFCRKNKVRVAVNSGEKKLTAKRPNLLAMNVMKALSFCKNCDEFSGEFLYDLRFLAVIFFHRIRLVAVKKLPLLIECCEKKITAKNRKSHKNSPLNPENFPQSSRKIFGYIICTKYIYGIPFNDKD